MLMASASFYCCFVFPYLLMQHPSTYKARESRHPHLHQLHSLGPPGEGPAWARRVLLSRRPGQLGSLVLVTDPSGSSHVISA